jgi:DNA-binding LacI/PurR family transcriptional regulator
MTTTPTIYDVAQRAGVSISTVSLALNKPDRVQAATLARIMDVVDELGFVPKSEAVTRARRGVGRIGVIAPFTSHLTFAQRLNGVLRVASRDERFEVVVYDQESAAVSMLVTLPLTRRVDGLIVMSVPFTEQVAERLLEQQLTTVLVELQHRRFSSVVIDDAAGGRMVAEYLLGKGHRRLAFIGQAHELQGRVLQSETRLAGFRDGVVAGGGTLAEDDVRLVPHDAGAAAAAARELLAHTPRPTAIFSHDDVLAGGALRAARELGLAVPDEVAVVGFDDSEIAAPLGLTSIRQPLVESGELAAEMLLAQWAKPSRSIQVSTLRLSLVERGTS